MVEIGTHLKYERFEFQTINESTLRIKNTSNKFKSIDISKIESVEIIGIKSASGYCGTMEWGMGNPTFILPTNFFYNIINLFKRKNDTVHLKVSLKNGNEFVVIGNKDLHNRLNQLLQKQY